MKSILILAMSMVGLACVTTSFADTSDIEVSNNQLVIQKTSTYVDYAETQAGETLDTEAGNVLGYCISSSWLNRGGNNLYFEIEYDQSNGKTNYTGMSSGGGAFGSVVNTSSAWLTNFSGRFGKAYPLSEDFMLTPYAELGSHKWDRGVNGGETYSNNWLGVGVLGQFSPVNKVVFSANALLGGTEGSSISVKSGAGLSGFSISLGNSVVYKFGLIADYAFTKKLHGNAGVDYTSFKYGVSHTVPVNGGSLEPDSQTNYTLIKLGVGFAF